MFLLILVLLPWRWTWSRGRVIRLLSILSKINLLRSIVLLPIWLVSVLYHFHLFDFGMYTSFASRSADLSGINAANVTSNRPKAHAACISSHTITISNADCTAVVILWRGVATHSNTVSSMFWTSKSMLPISRATNSVVSIVVTSVCMQFATPFGLSFVWDFVDHSLLLLVSSLMLR